MARRPAPARPPLETSARVCMHFGAQTLQQQPAAEPLGAERPQAGLVALAKGRMTHNAGANDALDVLGALEPERRRIEAELDAARHDHVFAKEGSDLGPLE